MDILPIVNQAFARRLWPKRSDILGQRFRLTADKQGQPIAVVGIVSDFQLFTVRDRTRSCRTRMTPR